MTKIHPYGFTTSKHGVARLAQDFVTSPWTVQVGGLVHEPRTFDLGDLRQFAQEGGRPRPLLRRWTWLSSGSTGRENLSL